MQHGDMEKLKSYLAGAEVTQKAFADMIGIHESVVSRFISGGAKPSLKTAGIIEQVTRGKVPAGCWFTDTVKGGGV
jgi:DNA-binding transcriptional regulator YdaS (Cro superfamily)